MPALVPRDRTIRIQRVLLGLLFANLAVVGAKFVIGMTTNSLAVIGDGVHSSVDAVNNVLALTVMWVAAREPDEDHPYGHTKFETLGALAIVVLLSVGGFELIKGAVYRLVHGTEPLNITGMQIAVLGGTLVINTVVAIYETRQGHALHSDLLLADAAHTRVDVFITLGVLAGVALSRAGYPSADPIVALFVAVAVVWVAWGIVRRSVPVLVDEQALPPDQIRVAAEAVAGVRSAYHVRSRGLPHHRFAELTIAVEGSATVSAAHEIADAVEQRLRDHLQVHEVIVHVEPC